VYGGAPATLASMSAEDAEAKSSGAQPAAALGAYVPEGGFFDSDAILDRFLRWVERAGLTPYEAQEEALLELMTGRHVVLATPTGSGKSLVALGLHFKGLCEGRRSFYTAPIKALVSEKFFALCEAFGPENVGMLTGDASINWAAPIICCTAEVLSNMALHQGEALDAPYVVMDEFHYYADADRGVAWQVPLVVLRRTTFLLMSATLGNTASIEERIQKRTGREIVHVYSDERPVPLDFDYRETPTHETIEALLEEGRAPVYLVHFTQREAAEQAQALTSAKILDRETKNEVARALVGFRFDSPYGKDVQRFLRNGIGLHHAGLLPKYRLLVEQLAQRGLLRVICGTDTLGVGVNIPIRTVAFTKLCKFDGQKTTLLSVRDFRQIAGRAGRRGFDERGSVVCQAPEHTIENKRLAAKEAGGGKRKPRKKQPARGFVNWTADTFQALIEKPPEALVSRFRVDHGMLLSCLQSAEAESGKSSGYRALGELITHCHDDEKKKSQHRRRAALLFRALRQAGVVGLVRASRERAAEVQIDPDLQQDFSLHHSLALYLVEAVTALDKASESYAFDVLSLVEAILENPRPILYQQERKAKQAVIAQLKAEGVPYEERIERVDEITWPRPNAEFIEQSFEIFCAAHPWIEAEDIHPKGIFREMAEAYASFEDTVKRLELGRMEGLLLRYLGQVYTALSQTVPESAKTEELEDLRGYLRTLVAQVDSSLLGEWERMIDPRALVSSETEVEAPPQRTLLDDPRAFRARVRAELHALLRALSRRDYEAAARCVRSDVDDAWEADRFESALAPYYEEYESILFDPGARAAHRTLVKERESGLFDFHQVLVDEAGDETWNLEGEIDLRDDPNPPDLFLRLRRIGP